MIYGSEVPRPGRSELPDWPTFSLSFPTQTLPWPKVLAHHGIIFCICVDTDLFMKKCNFGKFQHPAPSQQGPAPTWPSSACTACQSVGPSC